MSISLLQYIFKAWGTRRTQTLRSIEGVVPTLFHTYLFKACGNKRKEILGCKEDLVSIFLLKYSIKGLRNYREINQEIHRGFVIPS